MSVAIKLRGPNGENTTLKLSKDEATLGNLRLHVQTILQIDESQQEIKVGFPPKIVDITKDGSTRLAEVGINHGDAVNVSRVPISSQAAPAPLNRQQPSVNNTPPVVGTTTRLNETLSSAPPAQLQSAPDSKNLEDITVEHDNGAGYLVVRIVPDDNECLFHSLGIVLEQSSRNLSTEMRQKVAEKIRNDPVNFPDIVLGQSRDSYIQAILKKSTWGGAIELAILSDVYQIEIDSIDVQTGTIHRFGEDKAYALRAIVVYSGIHYDAVTSTPIHPRELATVQGQERDYSFDTTLFQTSDEGILGAALKLVSELRKRRYYTDTANFLLKCTDCGTGLKGESDARNHATQTGHTSFGEYE